MKYLKVVMLVTAGVALAVTCVSVIAHTTVLEALRVVLGNLIVLGLPGYVIARTWMTQNIKQQLLLTVPLSVASLPLAVFFLKKFLGLSITTNSAFLAVTLIVLVSLSSKYLTQKILHR